MTWHWPFFTTKYKATIWRSGESITMKAENFCGSCSNQILRSTKNAGNLWISGIFSLLSHNFSDFLLHCCTLNLILFIHYSLLFLSSKHHNSQNSQGNDYPSLEHWKLEGSKHLLYSFYHKSLVFLSKRKKIKNNSDLLTLTWGKGKLWATIYNFISKTKSDHLQNAIAHSMAIYVIINFYNT